MDVKGKVEQLVQYKIGKVIENELKYKIQEENSSFDLKSYSNDLFDKYFKNDIEHIKKEILSDNCFLYSNSSNSSSLNSIYSFDPSEYDFFSIEKIINNLQNNSEEIQLKSLDALEKSDEELINQTSWNIIRKILQKLLEDTKNKKIHILILKIFQKYILYTKKPHRICEGFISLAEIIILQIEYINSKNLKISFEEICDLKEEKWFYKKLLPGSERLFSVSFLEYNNGFDTEFLIKSMWLIIECQRQITEKWIRFNEKKLREIIFSFIHLLSSTTISENTELSGLSLVSILNPTASWCRYWCHTTIGRSFLCAALRKYKSFLRYIVDIILNKMKMRETDKLQNNTDQIILKEEFLRNEKDILKPIKILNNSSRTKKENKHLEKIYEDREKNKCVRSASAIFSKKKIKNKSSEKFIENIPQKIVAQATFCHCICLVVCLIQFRSGRSLFPLQTTSRKRLLSVQELILSMVDYLENFECDLKKTTFTNEYRSQILEIVNTLKNIRIIACNSQKSAEKLPVFC